jgi:hypothetical protein
MFAEAFRAYLGVCRPKRSNLFNTDPDAPDMDVLIFLGDARTRRCAYLRASFATFEVECRSGPYVVDAPVDVHYAGPHHEKLGDLIFPFIALMKTERVKDFPANEAIERGQDLIERIAQRDVTVGGPIYSTVLTDGGQLQ